MREVSYTLTGVVEHGFSVARSSGYPTANVVVANMPSIPEGIYCAWTQVGTSSERIPSVVFYGVPHALPGVTTPRFEVHLLDTHANLYGENLTVELVAFVRENRKFEDDASLHNAIEEDMISAREYFKYV